MNDTSKYVVSSTLKSTDWRNSTILRPYSAEAIRDLKARVGGGIYVSGSGMLVRAMLGDELIDELHLFMFPLALGSGQRLFPEGTRQTKLKLSACRTFDNGVLHLTCRPATS
jgi:dihydrofolate reductase